MKIGGDSMLHCPNCGTKVKEDERYCIKCGKALPEDMDIRIEHTKPVNKWWVLPIATIVVIVISVGIYSYILQYKTAKALKLYIEAEQLMLDDNFNEANKLLEEALKHRKKFTQASTSLDFSNEAVSIETQLQEVDKLLTNKDYKTSLEMIDHAEEELSSYSGPAVSMLVEKINNAYSKVKIEQLRAKLDEGPSINELRILIWEAEEVNHPDANSIATTIRERIIDYTFSKASEELNAKQFNDAILIAEDGLKYAPESEKLQSLLTNINKEKLSFENEIQQRMEQAMDTAYKESQINENDAIEILSVKLENNDEGEVVIKGEVKSTATVPINTILIEYALLKNDKEVLTNEIFVFPDTLYPTETGKFEFTHFDIKDKSNNLKAEVKKVTWYTN